MYEFRDCSAPAKQGLGVLVLYLGFEMKTT